MAILLAGIALAMVIGEFATAHPSWQFAVAGILAACLFFYSGLTGRSPWFWD
jgi:hypothetical protein